MLIQLINENGGMTIIPSGMQEQVIKGERIKL